ncbi:MAG: 23S rRNA (uracil(1939)-C(5))-methyltransferase RlmD [Lachnospiraceae bacterium]
MNFKENKKEDKKEDKKVYKKKSACPVTFKCGGCEWIDKPYKEQLVEKKKYVSELLKPYCNIKEIIGMEDPLHYRNKVHAAFDRDSKGNVIAGTYEKKTHRVVGIENCLIQNEKANAIICSIRDMCKSFKIKTYDEDTGYGLLRYVMVRYGYHTGQYMVVLVLGSPILPSKNNFVKALRQKHPEITTIVLNINNRKTSMVLGDKESVIYGKGYIEDVLCGKRFRISPKSFYQVNPIQTEKLYAKAMEYANLTGKEVVVDAYCGTGTIGMIAAEHAKEVIGVELNGDAVKDARVNAKANEVKNISFYQKDAGDFLVQMAEQKAKVDVVLMDPPRAGSDDAFLTSVLMLKPKRIVYISCNPETLARDLDFLVGGGYRVKKACAVDMFPQTKGHVETVCVLEK